MVANVDGFVFLHGGLAQAYVNSTIETLNLAAWEEVERLDGCRKELLQSGVVHPLSDPGDMVREGLNQLQRVSKQLGKKPTEAEREELEYSTSILEHCIDYENWFLVREDSPIWFRGYARMEEAEALGLVERGLARHGARAFVVGHTPQPDGKIQMRFDGRVFLIDTGMLERVYKGNPSALVIDDESVRALYLDSSDPLISLSEIPPLSARGRVFHSATGEPLPWQSDAEVVDFLSRASVTPLGETDKGINKPQKVELRLGEVTALGVFRDVDISKERFRDLNGRFYARFKDSFRFEVAAYEIDRALGLGRVPPAVLRKVEGQAGSLQIWVHNVFDEEYRREHDLSPPDPVAFAQQNILRRFFDALIGNFDRNLGNILIDRDTWRMWFIDHTRAFLEEPGLQAPEEVTQCDRQIWQKFVTTDFDELAATLSASLTQGEIKMLRARWLALEALVQERIDTLGEQAVLFDLRN
jgi:hypothetical protein